MFVPLYNMLDIMLIDCYSFGLSNNCMKHQVLFLALCDMPNFVSPFKLLNCHFLLWWYFSFGAHCYWSFVLAFGGNSVLAGHVFLCLVMPFSLMCIAGWSSNLIILILYPCSTTEMKMVRYVFFSCIYCSICYDLILRQWCIYYFLVRYVSIPGCL